MSSRTGVRAALVGVFALLATMGTVAEVRSQPGRPGFARPGGAGITGMPSRPGGITGMPARPGGITGMPGGVPRGPQFQDVWVCGGCKAELGRGPIKPSYASCPKCGVRFVNSGPGPNLFTPPAAPETPTMPTPGGPGMSPPEATPTDPDLTPRSAPGVPTSASPANTAPAPTGTLPFAAPGSGPSVDARPADTSSTSSGSGSKTGSLILKIMIGVFGLLFVLGVVGGTILIVSANKGKTAPKRRRKARDLDDDDD